MTQKEKERVINYYSKLSDIIKKETVNGNLVIPVNTELVNKYELTSLARTAIITIENIILPKLLFQGPDSQFVHLAGTAIHINRRDNTIHIPLCLRVAPPRYGAVMEGAAYILYAVYRSIIDTTIPFQESDGYPVFKDYLVTKYPELKSI